MNSTANTSLTANRLMTNSLFSFLSYVAPIGFSIILTPLMLRAIGTTDFGVYVLIGTTSGLLGLLDLGLSSAFIKRLSDYSAKNDSKIKKFYSTHNSLFLMIGLIGLLIFILLGWLGTGFFNLPSANYQITFLIGGLVFLLQSLNYVINLGFKAINRYDLSSRLEISQTILFSLTVIFVSFYGLSLNTLLTIGLLFIFLFYLIGLLMARKTIPHFTAAYGFNKQEAWLSYDFGLKTFVSNLAAFSIGSLDRFIIPIFLGPVALTYYSLPGNIATHIQGVTNSFISIMFPAVSHLNALNDSDKIRLIYKKSMRLTLVISTALAAAIYLFSYQILAIWLGQDIAAGSAKIIKILIITYWLIAVGRPIIAFAMGLGKLRFLAFWSTTMALLNIVFLLLLLPRFGIIGAAWAYLVSVLPIILAVWQMEHKILGLRGQGRFYFFLFSKLTLTVLVFYVAVTALFLPLTTSLWSLVSLGPLSVASFILLYLVFRFFEAEDVADLFSFAKKILKIS